jgi:hypothetical protein
VNWTKSRKRDHKGGWISDDSRYLIYRFGKFYTVKDLETKGILTHGKSFDDAVARLTVILEKERK